MAYQQPQYQQPVQYQNTQPGVTPQMQAGGNRNALNKPFNSQGERDWSYGLCDCFGDCGTCCLSYFCPCVVYSQIKSRLQHLEHRGYPHPEGGDSVGVDCCIYAVLLHFGVAWALQMGGRGNIRNRYRIEGSGLGDCCASAWCIPCDLTLESREVELEERSMIPKA